MKNNFLKENRFAVILGLLATGPESFRGISKLNINMWCGAGAGAPKVLYPNPVNNVEEVCENIKFFLLQTTHQLDWLLFSLLITH